MSTILPRIYVCSDQVDMVDFIDINYGALSLSKIPTITVNASVDVNIYISDKTTSTARINFSQRFIGTVYYTVVGFN